MSKVHFAKTSSVISILNINRAMSLSGHVNQTLWQLKANLYFHSCNWDQMGPMLSTDPRTDSVETSISFSVGDAISFSIFCTLIKTLLKQWLMTGLWCHKLTSQSDAPCGQLRPLCQLHEATSHNKTSDVLRLRTDFAEGALPSKFMLN